MKSGTRWISEEQWTCSRHIPMQRFPKQLHQCWFCKAERPPLEHREEAKPSHPIKDVVRTLSRSDQCAWKECQNKAASNSKYCSRSCSNKNARARFAARKSSPPDAVAEAQPVPPLPRIPLLRSVK